MRTFPLLIAIAWFAGAGFVRAQAVRSKEIQKRDSELPDVTLVIPDETRPEVKAILKENAITLASSKWSDRSKAAQVLGELGEAGKPARGLLCRAMLDRVPQVNVAAADALKKIDPKIQYLAVALLTEEGGAKRKEIFDKIGTMEDEAQPLSPLVAHSAFLSAAKGDRGTDALSQEVGVLSRIAKNDLAACKIVASALNNSSGEVRRSAIESLRGMKHGGLAVSKLITLLKTEMTTNRIVVIKTLTIIADKKTEEIIAAAIGAQRYHKEESIRKAVEEALNKLENKKDS